MEAYVDIGVFVILLLLGYFAGQMLEQRHYRSILSREERLRHILALPLKHIPGVDAATEPVLVTGAVCVSIDYFKRFAAGLRNIFGGRIASYETVIDRARREATLRMKERAEALGYEVILCVRLETARIAGSRSDGRGTAGMEVVAYGTAVRMAPTLPAGPSA